MTAGIGVLLGPLRKTMIRREWRAQPGAPILGSLRHLRRSTMGNTVREFMTHWDDPAPIWFERDEDELIGTQRSGGRPMPRIRVFDLSRAPTNAEGNKPPVLWAGEDGVIAAHAPSGPE